MMTSHFRARHLVAAALLALVAPLAACGGDHSAQAADSGTAAARSGGFALTPEQRQRIHVETMKVVPYRPTVEATGTVAFNGDRSTQVLSPVSGPAVRVLVSPGAIVSRGQPLALVSSPDFAAAVAGYRKAQTSFVNAKRIADRDSALFKNDALARGDLEQAQADVAGAEADVEAAVQQLRSIGVEQSQIDAIRQAKATAPLQAVIRAPIEGTVVEKLITEGQLLTAGSTPAFTVADLSTMWVNASVFASDLPEVTVGQPVDVVTDAAEHTLAGKVDYIASLVDPGTKAVAVRILVPNMGRALRRDMFVRVLIHSGHEHSGILVPVSSVLRDEQNLPFVFVASGADAFVRRRVDLGSRVDNHYAVTGLQAGEKVVAEGALFLQFAESQ